MFVRLIKTPDDFGEQVTPGGIVVNVDGKDVKWKMGQVVAVGPGRVMPLAKVDYTATASGGSYDVQREPMGVAVGDRVMFAYAEFTCRLRGEEHVIIKDGNIAAVLERKAETEHDTDLRRRRRTGD